MRTLNERGFETMRGLCRAGETHNSPVWSNRPVVADIALTWGG